MSKPKHTPGPWRATQAGANVKAGAITDVAYLSRHLKGEEERKANADLIAAAPDLLDLVERALPIIAAEADRRDDAFFGQSEPYWSEMRDLANRIEALILKARALEAA